MSGTEVIRFTYQDADTLWQQWAPDPEDVLARAAFERMLRYAAGIEDEGLYFRPGGWVVDLPETAVRIILAAAILAAAFQIVGLEDLPREIIIATAGCLSGMDVRRIRLTQQEREIVDAMRDEHLEGAALSAAEVRRALPRRLRRRVSASAIADALDRLVAAGLANRSGKDEYVLRARSGEAWFRLTLHQRDPA